MRKKSVVFLLVFLLAHVISCGGGPDDTTPQEYTIGGIVSGLDGSLILQCNNGDDLVVSLDGSFVFNTPLDDGSNYAVSILSSISTTKTCSVANGSGTVAGTDITSVTVICVDLPTPQYAIGGTVTGLDGSLVLQNNNGDNLAISQDGDFVFSTLLDNGSSYSVSILSYPSATQSCSVTNGSGTVSGADVTSVNVTCENLPPQQYTVGGTVSGIDGSMILRCNNTNDLIVPQDGNFQFITPLDDGSNYEVSIYSATSTTHTCSIANTSGNVAGADVTSIAITCKEYRYFTGANAQIGYELWKTDGTEAGTVLVKDINPSSTDLSVDAISSRVIIIVMNGSVYFSAYDSVNGYELWKSDGTEAGTVMVKNINPAGDSDPVDLINVNGTLYFMADDGVNGHELWKSDGTEAGTVMVKNINPLGDGNVTSFEIRNFEIVNGVLFFLADDGVNGVELWKTDGTEAGTVMVKNINPNGSMVIENWDSFYRANVNGTLFFAADDGVNGVELWKTDGTEAGTVMVKDICSSGSSFPVEFINVNGTLFFAASDSVDISPPPFGMIPTNCELWKSDGTEAGTVLVKDILPDYSSIRGHFTNWNNTLFFLATDDLTGFEIQLWKSDGTEVGTVKVKGLLYAGQFHDELHAVDGKLLITLFDYNYDIDSEFWVSDGTESGTNLVKKVKFGQQFVALPVGNINDSYFFVANREPIEDSSGLWKFDGTDAGTIKIKDISP